MIGFIFIRDYLRQFIQDQKQHISVHAISKVMAKGGNTRINWKRVEGQESYIRKTEVPYHYYTVYYNLLSLVL